MVVDFMVPDLRIWDQFYGTWKPLAPVTSVDVSHHADLTVDTMTIKMPAPHPLDKLMHATRVKGLPVTLRLNGVDWTGQIESAAQSRADSGVQQWTVTVLSDDKFFHRLQAKSPVTSANGGAVVKKGTIGAVMDWLVRQGVSRTGLPAYVCRDMEGKEVEVTARTEDSVADLLSTVTERADTFIQVQMLTPDVVAGGNIPGDAELAQYMGPLEREWYQRFREEGGLPYIGTDERVKAAPAILEDIYQPAWWFAGTGAVDQDGRPVKETTGVAWNPFEKSPAGSPTQLFYPDGTTRSREGVTRVAAKDVLEERAATADHRWFGTFVTYWAAGQWVKHLDTGLLQAAAEAGLVVRGDGKRVKTTSDVQELDRYIGDGEAHAWQQAGEWVIANHTDYLAELSKRKVQPEQPVWPGVMIRLFGERDRRHVVFSTAPGGGLESWEAKIKAPDGAALLAAAQWDSWMHGLLNSGKLSKRASDGVQAGATAGEITAGKSQLGASVADAVKSSGGAIAGVNAAISPRGTVDGTDVAFSALNARVDMSITGPMFYRERFHSIGSGEWTADVGATFEEQWSQMQGSTSMELHVNGMGTVIFGDDQKRPDGTTIYGWREGDRVTFIDGDTQLSEVISGWEASWSADKPFPAVKPLLGKRTDQRTPVDSLVDMVHKIQKLTQKTSLAPARVPKRMDVERVANKAVEPAISEFQRQADAARAEVRSAVDESRAANSAAQSAIRTARKADLTSEEGKKQAIAANSTANAAQQTAIESLQKSSEANAKASEANSNSIKALEVSAKTDRELISKNAEWNRLQDVGLKELESQQAAMKRFVELSKPGMVTADSWTPVQAGPVQVSYPSRNRIQFYLSPSNVIVGASVLGVARVKALSGYSSSFTVEINAGETVTPGVGGFEAFQKVSVTVHPIVDFAAILTEERRKRGLQ